jgi:predicted RNA binding protein YcfA (HicA-like mRNA interferase family)
MGQIGTELKRILRRSGFELLRQGKGDHEIWVNRATGVSVTIDVGTKSRHLANAILKKAGLPKAF